MDNNDLVVVSEGEATIFYPPNNARLKYNASEIFSRDLNFSSGNGLKSIRFFKEIPIDFKITMNDFSKESCKLISKNANFNKLDNFNYEITNYYNIEEFNEKFDIIDLEIYNNSPIKYLESAIKLLSNENGLLALTFPDMGILAGNAYYDNCFATYGSIKLGNNDVTHESAIRIVLNTINLIASRHKKFIEPMISVYNNNYIKIYIQIIKNPLKAKNNAIKNSMMTFNCINCGFLKNYYNYYSLNNNNSNNNNLFEFKFQCNYCKSLIPKMTGPFWAGAMHNSIFIEKLLTIYNNNDLNLNNLQVIKKIELILKELKEIPFFFKPSTLASILKCPKTPSLLQFSNRLEQLGYNVSPTHCASSALKTDAPWETVCTVMEQFKAEIINYEN
ncbi:hypothetical protein PACTADRAFT_51716 [Pachysolen tannophilus NRRL Y-2460]|uniref:tRNA (guanine(26)-N(2))-dimethyltransferase n=1 Tax=Pachysolen tannophilus NRRL Y-2460 TaxID=669874 RepID=A0A1E4TQM9_PACTA|nr:hypothetical protein PACTADRAFT_51716 [Pachysolen tannophilus NRRL Y-2460]